MELEAMQPKIVNGPIGQGALHSGAFPKSLLNARARNSFIANLREAVTENETAEESIDPILTSRHIGPAALKRAEEEQKERQEEEARELRRSQRNRKPQNLYLVNNAHSVASHKGKDVAGTPSSHQPLLTYAPAPPHDEQDSVLVSNKGTRLRIKPPHPPPQKSSVSGPSGSHDPVFVVSAPPQSHLVYNYGPPHPHEPRSRSPVSPMAPPPDEPLHHTSYSPSYYRNGNGTQNTNHNDDGSPSLHRQDSGNSSHPSNSPNFGQHQYQAQYIHQMQIQDPSSQHSPGVNRGPDVQRHAKPKRLKAHTVTSKSFSIPMVPRDKKGRPMLPLNVGIMTVISLGEVCMREHFHTERYIFPVGYEVTRYVFFSL